MFSRCAEAGGNGTGGAGPVTVAGKGVASLLAEVWRLRLQHGAFEDLRGVVHLEKRVDVGLKVFIFLNRALKGSYEVAKAEVMAKPHPE